MTSDHVALVGMGAFAPLGLNRVQVATAVRARQFEPFRAPFADLKGRAVGLGRCLSLPDDLVGFERFVRLGAPALREASTSTRRVASALALWVVLPDETRPDQCDGTDWDRLPAALAAAAGVAIDERRSGIVRGGHAAFATAMEKAVAVLAEGGGDVVLGGVDTAFHPEVVWWLDERGRIQHEDDDRGRIPSEAGAFVRLSFRPSTVAAPRLLAVHTGSESAGDGKVMGRLLRRVAAIEGQTTIGWVLSDLNGERVRTDQWLIAERAADWALGEAVHDELVPHLGDVGAATGPALAVIGSTLTEMGANARPILTLALHGDEGDRGVVALKTPEPSPLFRCSVGTPIVRSVVPAVRSRKPTAPERSQMDAMARGCLEDIGSMALLLTPGPVEPSVQPARAGQRLIDSLDALAALAAPVPGAVRHPDLAAAIRAYGDAVATTPGRAHRFAVNFALAHCCADGGQGGES